MAAEVRRSLRFDPVLVSDAQWRVDARSIVSLE
jgi:hypothetical protein